jgi:hypothetical protein
VTVDLPGLQEMVPLRLEGWCDYRLLPAKYSGIEFKLDRKNDLLQECYAALAQIYG